jgi:hypothetical protein
MYQSTPTKMQRTEAVNHSAMLKKQKVLDRMRQSKFAELKGSSSMMNKLHKQRSAMKARAEEEATNQDMFEIIKKQQVLVTDLNNENIQPIQQNQELQGQLQKQEDNVISLAIKNNELYEQNISLKCQLLISQNNCAQSLKELQNVRMYMKSLSIKNS